jgi:NADH-quinone oxidoreductase subunit J
MEHTLIWIFSLGAIISGFFVISAINPIHSVFGLIMAFGNVSFILLMLEIEFLAFLFLIVYIGAIAILFLFVVMMLDIRLVEIFENSTRYLPIGFIVGIIFIMELLIILDEEKGFINNIEESFTSIEWLGNILYTEGFYYFIIASVILLIAMIGAIILTLYHESAVRRQDIFTQVKSEHDVRLRKNVIK